MCVGVMSNERLKGKTEGSTRLTYTGLSGGTWTPKDRDEVKRRKVWECEGWVCDLDGIGVTPLIRLIRRTTVLKRLTKDVSHFQLEMRRTPRDCNGTLCWIKIVQVVKRKKSNNNRYKGDSVRGRDYYCSQCGIGVFFQWQSHIVVHLSHSGNVSTP